MAADIVFRSAAASRIRRETLAMLSDLETRVLSTTAITHRIRGVTIAQVRYALDRMHEAGELDKDLVRTGDGKQVTSLWSLP